MFTELKDGITITQTLTFETIICCQCQLPFAVTTNHRKNLKESHDTFYCPSGHPQHYVGKSQIEKLQEEFDKLKKQKRDEEERLYNLYLDEMNKTKSLSKQLKRIHKGVCPCCNRSFVNLKRHMETKHPEIVDKSK